MKCKAKTRSGRKCKSHAMANGRCRMHCGKARKGAEHPNLTHLRYSKYAPDKIIERYQDMVADPKMLTRNCSHPGPHRRAAREHQRPTVGADLGDSGAPFGKGAIVRKVNY